MMKTSTLVLLGSLITTLSGCAASTSPSASRPDVTGRWMGGTANDTRNVTLQLQQTGTNVTGTLAGAGVLDGPIRGTVEGNTIQLAPRSGVAATPRLIVRGDLMYGELDGVPLELVRLERSRP
jgi:hypothetical protein